MQGAGVIAFHDFKIIEPAIIKFLHETSGPKRAYLLKTSVFVVELGSGSTLMETPPIRDQLRPRAAVWRIANHTRSVPILLEMHWRRRRATDR
jgi:hypothetical protein